MRAGQAYLLISSFCVMGIVLALPGLFPAAVAPSRAIAQVTSETMPLAPGKPGPELPADGAYLAGEALRFSLDRYRDYERLRFAGNDEIYYLTIEPAALGGRVLKYDTGDVALQVARWGGVTLYTRETPGGMPAERTGSATDETVSNPLPDAKTLAQRLSEEIQQRTGLTIGFKANWDALNQSDISRALAADAIRNATRAIERVASTRKKGQALLELFDVVRIASAAEPGAVIAEKLLTVRIAPARGLAGRPSSLAIAKAIREKF